MVLRVTLVYVTTQVGNILGKLFSEFFMNELKNMKRLMLGD